jgi:Ca2+-binding RTX toxin-like protein
MKQILNTSVVSLFLVMLFITMESSPVFGADVCDKKPELPKCTGTDPIDGPIQLGSGDDIWPAEGDDNTGDDIVFGGDGSDVIYGGEGSDELAGEAGNDWLEGQDGDDRLNGGDGSDTLMGGNGNDHLYVDGSENGDFSDGGNGHDYLHLSFLDNVYVEFEDPTDPDSLGFYSGSFYVKKVGTITVQGKFKNIEFIYGSTLDGEYHGNDLANTIWGHEGNDVIFGYGGDDYLRGGGITLSQTDHVGDFIDGGEGNDRISGLIGDDYIISGPGKDEIWINDNGNHDIVTDFETGNDKIIIYNSNICWPDLAVTAIDSDNDGNEDDTLVAWQVRNASASVTLLNFVADQLSADDFVFEVEGEIPTYSGCP